MIGGSCTKCKVGSIMQSGTCIKPALGVDQYCSFYDGAYCISCVAGYKLANFTCQKAWSLIPLLNQYHSIIL